MTLQSSGLECAVPAGFHGGFRHTCSFCLVWGHAHSPREACLWGLGPYPVAPPSLHPPTPTCLDCILPGPLDVASLSCLSWGTVLAWQLIMDFN